MNEKKGQRKRERLLPALANKIKKVEKLIQDPLLHVDIPADELDQHDREQLAKHAQRTIKPHTEREKFCIAHHSGFKRWSQAVDFINGPREWMGSDVYMAAERVQSALNWARTDELIKILKHPKMSKKYVRDRIMELKAQA
jgi:hypothetical protein